MSDELGIENTCQNCAKRVVTTRQRTVYLKDYVGPCGDSFCYASCTNTTCRPIHAALCDACTKSLSKKEAKR